MNAWTKRLRFTLIVGLSVGYLYLAHQAATSSTVGLAAVLAALAPIVAGAIALSWRSAARYVVIAVCAATLVAATVHVDVLASHIVWVYFAQSAVTNLMLAIMFGRSLSTTDQALCTRMARLVHPDMPLVVQRYTYWLTAAWTLYFGFVTLVGVLLFASGLRSEWSWFINVLSFPLMGAMFAADILARQFFIPREHRTGIAATIRSLRGMERPGVAHIKASES